MSVRLFNNKLWRFRERYVVHYVYMLYFDFICEKTTSRDYNYNYIKISFFFIMIKVYILF